MKFYFAGSIRAGRDDVSVYEKMISLLKQKGEVLTEHVGDYSLSLVGQTNFTDEYIYDRDIGWLRSSDLVIAEVTNPSLGVGYEIASAINFKIPVYCFFRSNSGKQLSAMIRGCKSIRVFDYSEIGEALRRLEAVINEEDLV